MRGHVTIALWNPKTPANVGGVLRAVGCYGADLVMVAGKRRINTLRHLSTDTQKAWKHIPVIQPEDPFDVMPLGSVPVAIELVEGATSLCKFHHPERAMYVFGPEDGSLSAVMTARCKYKVMVPTKFCMNLAATVNVLLYDRLMKRS